MSGKLICLISLAVVLALAGNTRAADYRDWDDGDPADHLWSSPANWGPDGLPTMIGNTGNRTRIESGSGNGNYPILDATIFDVDPNGAFADRVYVGNSHGDGSTAELRVTDGARLTISDDLNIAYGNDSHGICYVSGPDTIIEIRDDIKVGRRGDGTLMMNGGTINVSGVIEIPSNTDTDSINKGHLQLNDGTITCGALTMRPNSYSTGTVDVRGGTLIIGGDALSTIQGFIGNGWITAYDGYGTLQLDYDVANPGKTTLNAVHVLNPDPIDGSTVTAGVNQLQWTLPEPNAPGGVITCDVYFGTNSDVETNPKVVTGQAESVSVTLTPLTTYYWAFDIYDSSISTTEPVHLSPIFTLNTMNTAPVVNVGDDIDTWLAGGSRIVQLDGIVSDEGGGPGPATLVWTVVAEPDESNPAQISDPLAVNTTVTVVEPGTYTLQLEAGDGEFTAADTVQVTVYADACEHASNQEGFEWIPGDLNHDCIVDELDQAIMLENWLESNYSAE